MTNLIRILKEDELTRWDTVMDCACTIMETNWSADQIKNGDLRKLLYHFAKAMKVGTTFNLHCTDVG